MPALRPRQADADGRRLVRRAASPAAPPGRPGRRRSKSNASTRVACRAAETAAHRRRDAGAPCRMRRQEYMERRHLGGGARPSRPRAIDCGRRAGNSNSRLSVPLHPRSVGEPARSAGSTWRAYRASDAAACASRGVARSGRRPRSAREGDRRGRRRAAAGRGATPCRPKGGTERRRREPGGRPTRGRRAGGATAEGRALSTTASFRIAQARRHFGANTPSSIDDENRRKCRRSPSSHRSSAMNDEQRLKYADVHDSPSFIDDRGSQPPTPPRLRLHATRAAKGPEIRIPGSLFLFHVFGAKRREARGAVSGGRGRPRPRPMDCRADGDAATAGARFMALPRRQRTAAETAALHLRRFRGIVATRRRRSTCPSATAS
jgi:hypothetical protein